MCIFALFSNTNVCCLLFIHYTLIFFQHLTIAWPYLLRIASTTLNSKRRAISFSLQNIHQKKCFPSMFIFHQIIAYLVLILPFVFLAQIPIALNVYLTLCCLYHEFNCTTSSHSFLTALEIMILNLFSTDEHETYSFPPISGCRSLFLPKFTHGS